MDSLEELGVEGLIPVELMARVVRGAAHSYTLLLQVRESADTTHYPVIEMSNVSFLGF